MSAHHDSHGAYAHHLEHVERQGASNVWEITRPPLLVLEPYEHHSATGSPSRLYPAIKRALDAMGSLVLLLALAPQNGRR